MREEQTSLPSPTSAAYQQFKLDALTHILLRGVFTDRIIRDSFRRQMARNTSKLDVEQMQRVVEESLMELGVRHTTTSTPIDTQAAINRANKPSSSSSGISTSSNHGGLQPRGGGEKGAKVMMGTVRFKSGERQPSTQNA
jgi:hypothetical protein